MCAVGWKNSGKINKEHKKKEKQQSQPKKKYKAEENKNIGKR